MSVVRMPAPSQERVLAAVAGGAATTDALVEATGMGRMGVARALTCLRQRGMVAGTARDGSVALTEDGRRLLAGDTSLMSRRGRYPARQHLVLAMVARGADTVEMIWKPCGVPESAVFATARRLWQAGLLAHERGGPLLMTDVGLERLAEWTSEHGAPDGVVDEVEVAWWRDHLAAEAAERSRLEALARDVAATARRGREEAGRERSRYRPGEVRARLDRERREHAQRKKQMRLSPVKAPVRLGPVPVRRRLLPTEGWVA
ncbi:hypothetical protein [Actinomyces faecalis]|uniref:hypothetical protein n=1 Tax=Actinomyces faecalis TaxID=2722820 RepID=UPI00155617A1|nr:hypothetical protein [Actinomyces faecalis]